MPLSDILCCSDSQVESAITSEEPYSIGVWFQARGIGTIELATLGELLQVGSYDELFDGFVAVGEPLEEGPWPEVIPLGLVEALKNISDSQVASVTPEWSQIEEFYGGVSPEHLAEYLINLRRFLVANQGSYYLVNDL